MMDFICNFFVKLNSAWGFSWQFTYMLVIVSASLIFASNYCFNKFMRKGSSAIIGRIRDFILILGYIISDFAILAIIAFMVGKTSFAFFSEANIIFPIVISLVFVAIPIVEFVRDIPLFIYTYRRRYKITIR